MIFLQKHFVNPLLYMRACIYFFFRFGCGEKISFHMVHVCGCCHIFNDVIAFLKPFVPALRNKIFPRCLLAQDGRGHHQSDKTVPNV